MRPAGERSVDFWLYVAACVAMIVGAFAPWATALGGLLKVSGVDSGDGWFLVVGAVLALLLLLTGPTRPKLIVAAIAGAICCAVVLYDLSDARRVSDAFLGLVHVGWGLYLSAAAAIGLTVQAIRAALRPTIVGTPAA
ncbi:MAG: hypothetical protein QOI98_2500 [Solirubrobacteraceae bacterium]|nr:hypothetical protein [Solirubrobacteraceae bacterium]